MGSGDVQDVVGPNTSPSTTTSWGTDGHPTLDELAGFPTFDAAILEFDFVPETDQVRFDFVFGSEEYNEFVESGVNDVFALFIDGENCALTPDGDPVTIDTINAGRPGVPPTNEHLYVNNDPFDENFAEETVAPEDLADTEMDGFTVVLRCEVDVNPGVTNHARFGIADGGDQVWDSWVFIGTIASVAPGSEVIFDSASKSWVFDEVFVT
jgi:hypothetical protein